ncbi:EscS/YscS/HrcS family type III secretion system export apparatus protein [Roseateles chitinivorans]|jgi:type III secretion protein S|uniref:EscS/YscS/HrcS family type III secretion system export apparatus protein n=1 Tax=Roseateles chitinivorans TaxID=2917965 RepID=A0A2G9C472_9BURK|nr:MULTISPECIES: type III secretion system export apparatus subunit SctS [Roseateles]MBB3281752.1 type III secretion protein S [Mitsuaria sp. BK037]MBB3293798.1 type III secretion protein S [Mitsuaria sp. BK041]MBB3363015.1 type III secretion protein S [Mitsuaria sp. BK045]PIM50444.1 EscS/YscS/HrcS family type III secretion system export apparatus protein [Roseateles chitinivorans]SFS00309.1 type III secretion protein S [Mitsuaria sp. PDC51]
MHYENIIRLTSEALMMCLMLSLPAVAVSAIVGLLISFVQAITSLQDSSISQGIKLLAVTVVVAICAPWAGSTLLRFSENLLAAMFL